MLTSKKYICIKFNEYFLFLIISRDCKTLNMTLHWLFCKYIERYDICVEIKRNTGTEPMKTSDNNTNGAKRSGVQM